MKRRGFLKTGSSVFLGGVVATTARASAAAGVGKEASDSPAPADAPSLLRDYGQEDHRRRLENIRECSQAIRACMRKHLVTDYLPAQCCYNLGEYPCRKPYDPDEYDEQELDRLKDHGIQVLQVFDDWNDSLRLFGGDKYTAVNPEGYHRFIDMAHSRGMKVLTYTSTCFLQRTDPDFRQEWSREGDNLVLGYWNMARCSPASPGWRAFLLPRLARIMDEYGSDGIYVDGGYVANKYPSKHERPPAEDEIDAFEETPEYDGAFADLLALIYGEVKRRGGILKLHVNAADKPQAGDLKVYDYLWVGVGVAQADGLREAVKNYAPYVVPCMDMGFTAIENADEPYLHSIPYMQFPVLQAGRVFTGERGMIPGVEYHDDFWMQRCRDAWKQYQSDPSMLHSYSAWDALPGSPETRTTHARWLRRYMPLVEEGTWAWLDIADSTLFAAPLPEAVVASAFANRDLRIVLANYGRSPVEIETTHAHVDIDSPNEKPRSRWSLAPRSVRILRWSA